MQDITGKNSDGLKEKTLYLLDMDGTIYNENEIFEGTLDFLDEIRRRGGEYIFITNNSSKSAADYVEKVRAMGYLQPGYCHVYKRKLSGTESILYGNPFPGGRTPPGRD